MYVPVNSPKYVCQACRNKIPVVDLESIFHDELKAFFVNPERVAAKLKTVDRNLVEKQALLAVQQKELQKVKDEMSRTHRLYLDGHIPLERYGEFHLPLEERLKQLETDIPKLEAEMDRLKIDDLSMKEVVQEAETLYSRWHQLPREEKRKIVESIAEKIVIGKDEIHITLSYLPSSEEMTKNQQRLC
jgi:site-specific DNA recombinase